MRLNLKTMRTSEETSRIKAILRAERDRNASAPFLYDAKLAFLENPETDPFDFCYAYAFQIRNIGAEEQISYHRAVDAVSGVKIWVKYWLSGALPDDVLLVTERSNWPWE